MQNGHSVTVISSNPEKQKDIEAIGAKAAIGSVTDAEFLADTFTGADAVYCMIPPNFGENNQLEYYKKIGNSYAQAIKLSNVNHLEEVLTDSFSKNRHTNCTGNFYPTKLIAKLFCPEKLEKINIIHNKNQYNFLLLSYILCLRQQ